MAEDIKEFLQENANKVGQDLLRQIDDGIGFVVIFVHKDSKVTKFTSNIMKAPLEYILQRVLNSIKGMPESRIITLNAPDHKIIKA